MQTRKSSQLKKWLILFCRLIIFSCIIFAFSEPFLDHNQVKNSESEIAFYIDNSFSNQEKRANGELLKVAIQEILDNYPNDKKINIITNTKTYKNKTLDELKSDLINLSYTPFQLDYKTVALKASQLFSDKKNSQKQLICISDFQKTAAIDTSYFSANYQTTLIQNLPVSKSNISIDNASFSKKNTATTTLDVIVKKQYSDLKSIPIALYNNDTLISKTAVTLEKEYNTVSFTLPKNTNLNLKVDIEDHKSLYDNTLFICKYKPLKQNILAIGAVDDNAFLSKIYTNDEFNFTQSTLKEINYSKLEEQHLIILNEPESIPTVVNRNLKTFIKNGGTVLCIPSDKIELSNYNGFNNVFGSENTNATRQTKIHFSHPIFADVFEKQIKNYQYPNFKKHYQLKNYQSALLSLENGNPLLVNNNNCYTFAASLSNENTNFKQSPLIVPTLYNIAKNSLKNGTPYYIIGKENTIDIPLKLAKDEVLNLEKNKVNFTPLQQIKTSKVSLQTTTQPNSAGIYTVTNKQQETPFQLAFNYNSDESLMEYHDITTLENTHLKTTNSVTNTILAINSAAQVATLWKWFVIFAVLFLLIELLILKYFK